MSMRNLTQPALQPGEAFPRFYATAPNPHAAYLAPGANAYRFGIEMELLLLPRLPSIRRIAPAFPVTPTWEEVALLLSRLLDMSLNGRSRLSNRTITNVPERYSAWCVTWDGTFGRFDDHYGVEIISPILTSNQDWCSVIRSVWRMIAGYFDIFYSDHCGTHIHISPLQGSWQLSSLKRLCKAIVIFDVKLRSLIPTGRFRPGSVEQHQGNIYAPGLWEGHDGRFTHIFNRIDGQASLADLVSYLSPRRTYSWNLRNLLPDGCGTVEFRKPPMVQDETQALEWIAFTLAFVEASRTAHRDLVTRYSNRTNYTGIRVDPDLSQFLRQGFRALPLEQDGSTSRLLNNFFAERAQFSVEQGEDQAEDEDEDRRSSNTRSRRTHGNQRAARHDPYGRQYAPAPQQLQPAQHPGQPIAGPSSGYRQSSSVPWQQSGQWPPVPQQSQVGQQMSMQYPYPQPQPTGGPSAVYPQGYYPMPQQPGLLQPGYYMPQQQSGGYYQPQGPAGQPGQGYNQSGPSGFHPSNSQPHGGHRPS